MGDPSEGRLMVPDWAEHTSCLIAWPVRHPVWEPYLHEAENEYRALIRSIARYEKVVIVAPPGHHVATQDGDVTKTVSVLFSESWIRDTGPVFRRTDDGAIDAVDFRFNGWGDKFRTVVADDEFAGNLCRELGISVSRAPVVLEGGSICTDGQGTIIAAEDSTLNPNRNPGMSRVAMSHVLKNWLGAERVIWIPHGLLEDTDTDGHVDNVVCYVSPGQILCQIAMDKSNPNYYRLRKNLAILSKAVDAQGRALEVIPFGHLAYVDLGMSRGQRVSSYLNSYFANGALIVPIVGAESDDRAIEAFESLYPGRKIVGTSGRYLSHGGGGVHCVTLGQPKANGG